MKVKKAIKQQIQSLPMKVKEAIKQLQNLPEDEDIFILTLRAEDCLYVMEYIDTEPNYETAIADDGIPIEYPVYTEEQYQEGIKNMSEDWSARLQQLNERTQKEYESHGHTILSELSSIFPELTAPWGEFCYDERDEDPWA